MSATLQRALDIVAAALILGLLLRYGDQAAKLISTSGQTFVSAYQAVSLQQVT